ncbi:MAG TPA: TonB-dependent receptor [Gammaproteobacteria bacterium]|nr:TonB-dependent receptor [Gammaproteobacteria bacterium]
MLLRRAVLSLGVTVWFTIGAYGQAEPRSSGLEEIIVTATRVETNLQQTPISVVAFTGEELELGHIDNGYDLGIMTPNVVLSPRGDGDSIAQATIRGLPGVATYVDGVWFGDVGFLQRSYIELDRIEILRGPQGTLFGRNSNGGAIQIVTRPPADDFGARFQAESGSFDRRTLKLAVDAPISDHVKTKWTAAGTQADGMMQSQTAPIALGGEDNRLLRGDVLWEPSERFSLRFNANQEKSDGSSPRVLRIQNPANVLVTAYNVLAGNPDYLARARAIDPTFPNPPLALRGNRFTRETHEAGYPGGTLGEWETRTNIEGATTIDQRYGLLTLNWHVTDHFELESLTAQLRSDVTTVSEYDASEFDVFTQEYRFHRDVTSQELHLIGEHFGGRLRSFLGVYYFDLEPETRVATWSAYEFQLPSTGPNPGTPGPPGVGGRPFPNAAAENYVRQWGATVGDPVAAFQNFYFITSDRLFNEYRIDRAVFGELTIGVLDNLDVTLGFRVTSTDTATSEYLPADSFRPAEAGAIPGGDPFAIAAPISSIKQPDVGTISTPRVSLSYRPTERLYLYASYAEGFTASEVVASPVVPDPIVLDPEIVSTSEIGLRSDWLDARLRFNATLFDSEWDGLRVAQRLIDSPFTIPSSDGVAEATGLEIDLSYLPGDRWQLELGLGLLDSEYVDVGVPPANGSGLQPGTPFAYAPDTSVSLSARYRWPLAGGAELALIGNYGWMDEYYRARAADQQSKNDDGSHKPEPAYGILNANVVFQPAGRNWQLSVFGTNLTDERYVNGGVVAVMALDYGTLGRPREVGIGMQFTFR